MNTVGPFHFDGQPITVCTSIDGRLWFCADAVCSALCYGDIQAALLDHCRPGGILFGNQQSPQAMIDLCNVLQLSHHCPPARAAQFHEWLCNRVLASQLDHSSKPQRHQLSTQGHHLQVLRWQENWWLAMHDAVQLSGSADELLPIEARPVP